MFCLVTEPWQNDCPEITLDVRSYIMLQQVLVFSSLVSCHEVRELDEGAYLHTVDAEARGKSSY